MARCPVALEHPHKQTSTDTISTRRLLGTLLTTDVDTLSQSDKKYKLTVYSDA